jgi:hypothetical protein
VGVDRASREFIERHHVCRVFRLEGNVWREVTHADASKAGG